MPFPKFSAAVTDSAMRDLFSALDHQPVDHHIDIVGDIAVEGDLVVQVDEGAVDSGAHEPFAQKILEILFEFRLFVSGIRGEHDEASLFGQALHCL